MTEQQMVLVATPCPSCDLRSLVRSVETDAVSCGDPRCGARYAAGSIAVVDRPAAVTHDQIVYYMRMDGLVKIGTSANIRTRFEALSPQGVMAVEYGDHSVERSRHRQFVQFHSHREWYHLSGELFDHVVERREAWLRETGETVEDWLIRHGLRG